MSAPPLAIGVDLGGTSLRVGLVGGEGHLLGRRRALTSHDGAEAVLEQVVGLVLEVAGDRWSEVAGIGVGVPAAVSPITGVATLVPNIPGLAGRRVGAELSAAFQRPVVVGNDAALAALGERWVGVARGCDDVVLLSLGTGAGAGIISGGRLLNGHRGAAGEVADLPVPGPVNGRDGAWFEAAVGTPALRRRLRATGRWADVPALCDAAGRGDVLARETLTSWAEVVAHGAMALVAVLDPDLLVLGGGIGRRPEVVDVVRSGLHRLTSRPPRLVAAALGDWSGVLGAAADAVPCLAVAGERAARQERA